MKVYTNKREFRVGDVVQHFKRETLSTSQLMTNKYLYQILAFAKHTETDEQMVVYQSLIVPFQIYVRPLDMFCSEVDRDKYPDIKQKYRFEQYFTDV